MARVNNRADVDRIKGMLTDGWNRILQKTPDETVYAFGIYTNECAQSMCTFLLGEKGLERVATRYVEKGIYTAENAEENLRWSTADSSYEKDLIKTVHRFEDRPDMFKLPPTGFAREVNYRLTAACTALRELDAEGLFGMDDQRNAITLYIEGGDVNREWILKWAKKLNPPPVFKKFEKIGATEDTTGVFPEFGTKKVYETSQYAQDANRRLVAAATEYHLFVFDTSGPKQLFAIALPAKGDYTSLGGVGMSGDGKIIAVIPFGGGAHGSELFIVTGAKGETVQTVTLKSEPMAVAVSPAGRWIAVTDESGALNVIDPAGSLLVSHGGHTGWPRGIAVSPDGSTFATADSSSLIIWNASDWSKRHEIACPVDSLDFDPTGQFIAACCRYPRKEITPRAVSIFDAQTGEPSRTVVVEGYRIQRARFSPDGRYLACAMRLDSERYSGTNTSALVEIETGTVIDRLKADFEQVRDFAFLPHRGEIAVAVFGHTRRPLVLWRPKSLA